MKTVSIKDIYVKAEAVTRHKLKILPPAYAYGWLEYPAQCTRCGDVLRFNSEMNALYTAEGIVIGQVKFTTKKNISIQLVDKEKTLCKRLLILS